MSVETNEHHGNNFLKRYRLRTLLMLITLVCIAFTIGKLWQDYQRGARDRGFIAGLNRVIDEGTDRSAKGYYAKVARTNGSARDYDAGYLQGIAYLSFEAPMSTRSARKAQVLSKLVLDFELEKSLRSKAIRAINGGD